MTTARHISTGLPQQGAPGSASIYDVRVGKVPIIAILYLIGVVFPFITNVGPLMMTSLRALLLVVTVPLVINLLSGRYGKVFFIDYLFLFHVIWAAIALTINNPDKVIEQVGSVGMEFIGGYVIGRAYIRDKATFVALCKLLVLIVLCLFPFALVETLTGRPVILEAIRSVPGIRTVLFNYQDQRMNLERVQMTFAHPIHWGLFCSVVFSLSFVALKGFASPTWRVVSSSIIGFCGFLALSSGALLALALQLGLIGWAIVMAQVKARWWILFGLAVLAYITVDLLSNRTPIMVFLSYATFSSHTAYWRTIIFDWGVDNILGNAARNIPPAPLFGIGLNDWIRPYYMYSGSMDNFWLVMGVRYGIPGFLTVTVGYIMGLYLIMRRNFDDDPILAQIRRAWVFTFMGLSFTLCTVHVWTNIYSFTFFMFGAGIWLITAQPDTDAEDTTDPEPTTPGSRFSRHPHVTRQDRTRSGAGTAYARTQPEAASGSTAKVRYAKQHR